MNDEATTYEATASVPPVGPRAFVAVSGPGGGVVDLIPGTDLSIGRSRSCAIHIDEPAASRLQALLRWDGGAEVLLTDRESKNGTFVDGARVSATAHLISGSEIRIGRTTLVVAITGLSSPATTGAPIAEEDELLSARDPAMLRVLALAERAARTDATVLLVGESGVGKEVVARFIHRHSARAAGPFVGVNCGSIPESLAEATLFGHERGAFTGAATTREGWFEAANGGTLLLDEVAELSLAMQARLLRVLEERRVSRVGGTEPLPIDVRIVAATNRDVDAAVRAGRLREDLLFRLDVLRIAIPPLRQRPDDLIPLAERFLRELGGGRPLRLAHDAAERLRRHDWPGNVRELRNVLERACALVEGDVLRAADLDSVAAARTPRAGGVLRDHVGDAEREAIVAALDACRGNQSRAARRLGISRRTLIYKLEKYGLKPPPAPREADDEPEPGG